MRANDHGQAGQDLIWNYYQNESPELFTGSRARIQYLLRRIPGRRAVLNIGCGTGLFERAALDHGLDVHSLDPSEQTIEALRSSLHLGSRAQVGHIQQIPFSDAQFDVVVLTEVLEHLTSEVIAAGLAEIRRILKPGGRILGTVPSRENLQDQTVVCPACATSFHRWGHQQSFEPQQVRTLLARHFTAIDIVERPFTTWSALTWRGKLVGAMKLLLWTLGSHGSNENIVFEAVKADTDAMCAPS